MATPTLRANPQTVQIPAGQNAASTKVSWNIGTGRSIIVVRVKVNDGAETDLATLPSAPGPGFISQDRGSITLPVKPGTNVFTLNQAGKTLATVTVTGTAPPATAPPQTETSSASPTISARPRIVTIPDGESQGTTTLTWDGGKDHPYAEVWVKVDDQDETFVVEQGKGTRRVTVERGKNYLFILSDSGKRLATVTVTAK